MCPEGAPYGLIVTKSTDLTVTLPVRRSRSEGGRLSKGEHIYCSDRSNNAGSFFIVIS
jgi:hypothetical protein